MKPLTRFPPKVYIEAVHGACNRRLLDAQKIASYFETNGYKVVEKAQEADILFLITCGLSLEREASSLRRIHALKKLDGKLIVGGCLPAINRQKIISIHKGTSIPTYEISRIDDCFQGAIQVKFSELADANRYYLPSYQVFGANFFRVVFAKLTSLSRLPLYYILRKEIPRLIGKTFSGRQTYEAATPYSIRVSWGCNQKCSYCGIRSAVGKFHSKPLETCLDEFRAGVHGGQKEFELIADDVGAYGIDLGKTFPELLDALFDIPGDYNVQIWNLSPVWFIKHQDAFIVALRKGKISGIHYPIESGSSRILKAMRRYSDTNRIKQSVNLMKECRAKLLVTTDVIVGYPGETDNDVNETIALLCNSRFDRIHMFLYNDVPTAASYTAEAKVPRNIAIRRIGIIGRELQKAGIDSLVMV